MTDSLLTTNHRQHWRESFRIKLDYLLRYSTARIQLVGWCAVLCFLALYWVWHAWYPQPYQSLSLHVLGSLFFLPLCLSNQFEKLLARFLTNQKHIKLWINWWFRFALIYALAFFTTFMLLQNAGTTVWLVNFLCGIFLLNMLVRWRIALLLLITGILLGWLAFVTQHLITLHQFPNIHPNILQLIPVYMFAALMAGLFNAGNERLVQERLQALVAASSNIAHELRTPLLSIESSAAGLQKYLPKLLEIQQWAAKQDAPVEEIRADHLSYLADAPKRLREESRRMHGTIDMLLNNLGVQTRQDDNTSEPTSLRQTITDALAQYPFVSSRERDKVKFSVSFYETTDCCVNIPRPIMLMIITNLIKNALKAIQTKPDGVVRLTLDTEAGSIFCEDNGHGISPQILPHIFERFFSYPPGSGSGVGLAFCQQMLQRHGASILCESTLGAWTRFEIHFPVRH